MHAPPPSGRLGYAITFILDFRSGTPRAHADLKDLLMTLMRIGERYLREHPETPLLYQAGIPYEEEPLGKEDWLDIPSAIKRRRHVDCLPISTLVLRDDYTFAPLGALEPGERIMGDGGFTTVTDHLVTGDRPILSFELDNGCHLRCSPDHRVFLADGTEVRAESVKVGDRLKAPSKPFPAAERAWSPDDRLTPSDLAWLVGTYVADGWHQKNSSFSISGDDVSPKRRKREQKDRVEAMMSSVGIRTRRPQKCVRVLDGTLTRIMVSAGSVAPSKVVPDLRLTLDQVKAMVEGLQTDASTASSGTLTHGTVSPILALQLRVLYRMLDQSVHIKRWDEHGGLGPNPIYRIGVRDHADEDTCKAWKTRAEQCRTSVRVRSVREEEPELCADITTDTGRFYLPESDTIVHNCEDLACWRAAELRVRFNIMAEPMFTWKVKPDGGYLYHILVRYPDGRIEDPSRVLGMR